MPGLPVAIAPVAAFPAATDPAWRRLLPDAELRHHRSYRKAGEHLTARVMARMAVAASLDWPWEVPWHDIAITREPTGRPAVALFGALRDWRRDGLPMPGVSLSHAAGHAAALAWLPDHGGGLVVR